MGDHEVTFVEDDGSERTVAVGDDERLLDAARREEIDLRYSCLEGRCTSCTGRLLDGEVTWDEPAKAVGEDERAEGFVSLCLTTADGDCTIAVGDGVLVDAFPAVWKHLDTDG